MQFVAFFSGLLLISTVLANLTHYFYFQLCWLLPDVHCVPASTLSSIFPLFLLYLSSKYIPNMMLRSILLSSALLASTNGFAFVPANMKSSTTTQLQMGLLDGVKNAFSQPATERSTLGAERETPIDRWMGWSVVQENQQVEAGSGGKWNESELFFYLFQVHSYSRELISYFLLQSLRTLWMPWTRQTT
jgi:hypothetical protein